MFWENQKKYKYKHGGRLKVTFMYRYTYINGVWCSKKHEYIYIFSLIPYFLWRSFKYGDGAKFLSYVGQKLCTIIIKHSRAISHVNRLNSEKTSVSRNISVLVFGIHQYPEDEDRDGPWNVGFSPFNQLTRLIARECFIIESRRESYKSYFVHNSVILCSDITL
jgi:hypothetical protein